MNDIGRLGVRVFVGFNSRVWRLLPARLLTSAPAMAYGRWLQRLVRAHSSRAQNPRTYFFRNRPELEVITSLVSELPDGADLSVAVLACSMGAEPYSLLWTIKEKRPDLRCDVHAIDIAPEVVDTAREGGPWDRRAFQLERMSPGEIEEMFDHEGTMLRVKQWLRESITFEVRDGADQATIDELGPQHLVLANRFLTHMQPPDAEAALRRLSGLVAPGGYLVCTGVDVDVRTRVVRSLGWTPIVDRIEELHEGDPTQRGRWPWEYWALEPLDKGKRDWQLRYATVFLRPA